MAEEEGFEPSVRLPVHSLSRTASSTTPALFPVSLAVVAERTYFTGLPPLREWLKLLRHKRS